jgi:dTMP kinase
VPDLPGGLFLTFEGGEGAGKSTQSKLLAESLSAAGYQVLMTREPGGTETAEKLRSILLDPEESLDPMEQVLLFYAARHNHVREVIRPALEQGKIVICDRFSDSTTAYQGAAGGLETGTIHDVDQIVLDGFKPRLTVLLDLPVADGTARVASRGNATDRFEQAPTAFHQRLREAFLSIAAAEPERFSVIDATQSITVTSKLVLTAVQERLAMNGAGE